MKENEEVLMENVNPEDLPTEAEIQEKPFIPSPPKTRILAWVLLVVLVIGIALWIMGIANPHWVDSLKSWLGA